MTDETRNFVDGTIDPDFKLGVHHLYLGLKKYLICCETRALIELYLENNEAGLALEVLLDSACSHDWCIKLHHDHGCTFHQVVLDETLGGRLHDKNL
jgi:hypothetical protein